MSRQTTHTFPRPPSPKMERSAGGRSTDSAATTKRLTSELMSLMMNPTPGVSAFPTSDANLLNWAGTIVGPTGTPYEGLTYRITLQFPPDYPYRAPHIKFAEGSMWHPNVDLKGGDICLDILKEHWSAVYSVSTILVSLASLLGEPNNASPLNVDAADLWQDGERTKKEILRAYKPIVN